MIQENIRPTREYMASCSRVECNHSTVTRDVAIAKPKFSSLPSNAVGRIGIAKEPKFDYIFQYLKVFQFDDIYHIRMSNPYTIYAPDKKAVQQHLGINPYRNILEQLQRIVNEANGKRSRLQMILLGNPYLPLSRKANGLIFSLVIDKVMRKFDQGYFFLLPIIIVMLLISVAIFTLCVIIDIFMCKLREIPSEKEVNWIKDQFDAYPELDTTVIDDAIHHDMNALCQEINQRYGTYAQVWTGVQTLVMGTDLGSSNQTHQQDEFMILVLSDLVVDVEVQIDNSSFDDSCTTDDITVHSVERVTSFDVTRIHERAIPV